MRRTPTSAVVLAVAVAVMAPCQSVLAQSGIRRVTMADALGAFASNSLELRIARAEAEAAIGTARQYRSYANPAFSLVHESLGSSGDSYRETIAGIAQRVEWPGRTAARSGVAVHAIDGASARFRADSVRLAFQVREAYVAAWLAEEKERTTREAAGVIRLVAEAARQRLEEGDISRYEARRFELELVRRSGSGRHGTRGATARRPWPSWLTRAEGMRWDGGSHRGTAPAVTPAVRARGSGRRPTGSCARDLDAREPDGVAMTRGCPIRVRLGYKDRRTGRGAGASVNLPVPVFDRGIGQRHGAAAQETAATHRLEFARRLAEMDLIAAADRYTSTRTQFEAGGEDPLADADFLLRTARTLYAEGEMSQLELLDAAAVFRGRPYRHAVVRGATWIAYRLLRHARAPGR